MIAPPPPPQPATTVWCPLDLHDVGVDYYALMSEHFVHLSKSMIRGINPLQGSAVFDPIELANQDPANDEKNKSTPPKHMNTSQQLALLNVPQHQNNNDARNHQQVMTPLSKLVHDNASPKITS